MYCANYKRSPLQIPLSKEARRLRREFIWAAISLASPWVSAALLLIEKILSSRGSGVTVAPGALACSIVARVEVYRVIDKVYTSLLASLDISDDGNAELVSENQALRVENARLASELRHTQLTITRAMGLGVA